MLHSTALDDVARARATRALVVAIGEEAQFHPYGGNGRVWQQLLAGLRAHDRIRLDVGRRDAILGRRRPDVRLASGHLRPLAVEEPVVSLVHEASWHDPQLREFLAPAFLEWIVPDTRAAVRASTRIIVPSRTARDEVVADCGCEATRVHVVPYGVDLECFRPGLPGGRQIVARARGGPVAPYILYVGSAHPRKNLLELREAFGRLVDRGLPHLLVLVATTTNDWDGSADLLAEACRPVPGHPDRVVHVPGLGDGTLAVLMAGADALCLPSRWEGFGLPALEAMACGTPVVVSNQGALPEVVGDAGIVVDPSVDGIERGLADVLEDADRAADLGAAARRRAEEFSWSRTVDGCIDVLDRAVADHGDFDTVLRHAWPGVTFEPIAECPLCREPTATSTAISLGGRPVVRRCRRCRLVFAPQTGRPDEFYVEGYHVKLGEFLHGPGLRTYPHELAGYRLALLEKVVGRPGALLDVGCGTGVFLAAARERGWEAHGVEPVPDSVDAARAQGFEVACGMLEDVRLAPGAYDVVAANHVLEHSSDPRAFLRQLGGAAGSGSHVFIEVPNWRSALRMRHGAAWWGLRPEQHISHFTPTTLKKALRMAGLEPVVVVTRTWLPRTLGLALAHLPGFARLNQWWLAPLSRPERETGVVARVPGTVAWGSLQAAARAYDAAGLGSAIVAVARVP